MCRFTVSRGIFFILMIILIIVLIIGFATGNDSITMPVAILLGVNIIWNIILWIKDLIIRKKNGY